jgi:enoyl-CoA hydratase/3-hydroxyacyl-CoA dehydrogenase
VGLLFHQRFSVLSEVKTYQDIIVKKEEGIGWITLNRPHRLNTMTIDMMNEFISALNDFESDKEVKCIVVTGAGEKAFSAGADVTSFTGVTPSMAVDASMKGHELTARIEGIGKPVIACINGYALGGGLEVSLACDFRIASESAQVGPTEIKLGLIPGWGGTQRLTRIVGLAKAKELVMLGDRITAEQALKIGLVTKVVPLAKLVEETKAFAKNFVEGPPVALKAAKHALNYATQVPLDIGLKFESEAFGIVLSTKDVMEGVSAFMSKRKPEFKGK